MLPIDLLQIAVEFALVYIFFYAFAFTGNIFLKKFGADYFSSIVSSYGQLFTSFFCGLFLIIYLYSVIVTKGLTVNLLILPLFYFLFIGNNKRYMIKGTERLRIRQMPYLETALISILVVFILHIFPESEYKQADSFYYLKIAESLNATGQENVNHYFNLYNSKYHGLEPYHYFEIWITVFIIRITEGFYASINIHHFVTQGVVLTAVITGLYYLTEGILKRKISIIEKVFCWSLLFIVPNLLVFFPSLYKVFISDFEGNILERPNFRIIYLLLIPVVLKLYNGRPLKGRVTYLLLLLSVVSFKCTVIVIPALVFYNLYVTKFLKRKDEGFKWVELVVFCVLFAALYFLFPVNKIPTFYGTGTGSFLLQTLKGWKFILYSIVTSGLYILIVGLVFLLPLIILYRKEFVAVLKDVARRFRLLLLIAILGLIAARVLYLKDNAYQFIFLSHIIATFLVWLMYLVMLSNKKQEKAYVLSAVFLSVLWFVKPLVLQEKYVDIFKQNGNYVYGGTKYSEEYLSEVRNYFQQSKNVIGAYICDSNFYKQTYYSRRSPTVYFLPVTYIAALVKNRNFEFCLSDPSDILHGVTNPVHKDYLDNAIQRSFFQQYLREGLLTDARTAVIDFLDKFSVSYLIATKDYTLPPALLPKVKYQIVDANTGERFMILQ